MMDFSSLTIKSHNSSFGYSSSLKTPFLKVPKGGFPLSSNVHVRTRVNKIKVMYDKPRVNVKVELGLTFAFTRVKFTYVRTLKLPKSEN